MLQIDRLGHIHYNGQALGATVSLAAAAREPQSVRSGDVALRGPGAWHIDTPLIEQGDRPAFAVPGVRAALHMGSVSHTPLQVVLNYDFTRAALVNVARTASVPETTRAELVRCAEQMVRYHEAWHAMVESGEIASGVHVDNLPRPGFAMLMCWLNDVTSAACRAAKGGHSPSERVREAFVEGGLAWFSVPEASDRQGRRRAFLKALIAD